MNFDETATEVPLEIVEEAHQASQKISDPETAKALFDQLIPILETCRPNRTFALACGMLMEKQRNTEGMLAFWSDLLSVFPEDPTSLRMMMRWYRRERLNSKGIERVHQQFPDCHSNTGQAALAIIAFSELKAFKEIDEMMGSILALDQADRALRMRYIKALTHQSRFVDAHNIAEAVTDSHRMGASSQELLSKVARRAANVNRLYNDTSSDIFSAIISQLEPQKFSPRQTLGNITFFTGQLGTGGAEKQLTRLAGAFQERYERASVIGNVALTDAPCVCVRHANPSSGGDFYLPLLKENHVNTNILSEMGDVPIDRLPGINAEIANLLDVLPDDIREQTCKLTPYFIRRRTRVAYLWQDGGVLSAALAALLAGVPRIVTSFRGLPPNLRPNLMRPELEPLYRALANRPEVLFTANSACAAEAYQGWLDLPDGSVKVIPNAIPEVLPEGDQEDYAFWSEVEARSKRCTKTVLGIFRFDENKRPLLWIDAAIAYGRTDPNTRFIILGSGYLLAKARERIRETGMHNQIFLGGIRQKVGFYLHRCDLVMHLARMEGLPNVLIEAHLAAKPVLATPAGGTAEVVCNGITGRILPDSNNPLLFEITDELSRLLSKPKRLKSMGTAALADAQPKYLMDRVLEKTVRLFMTGEC